MEYHFEQYYAWSKKHKSFEDKPRRAKKSKITPEIEEAICQVRVKCKYGSAAIVLQWRSKLKLETLLNSIYGRTINED